MTPIILATCLNPLHTFSKRPKASIHLLAGLGVQGDAHCGQTVQHLYLKRKDPHAPNRMQVHLLQSELFSELAEAGHRVRPGELGENITTQNIALLRLPLGTHLHLGPDAIVELTGLRTPCKLIDIFQPGLLRAVIDNTAPAGHQGRAGVMAIVIRSGTVAAGDSIHIVLPPAPHVPLAHI